MPDEVEWRGRRVAKGWPERFAESQQETTLDIRGEPFARVRYGDESEDWGADRGPCRDCGADKGEFHAFECDIERCPQCEGQRLGCDCSIFDEDEP